MAREVKIKKADGKFYEVRLPEDYQAEFNKNLDRSKKNGETIIRETREYEVITPLFGGGAENKKADEISIIRATEIRGHLRFWWRATRGGQFPTIEELKKHEDAIFGSTERNSALQLEVVLEEDYAIRKKINDTTKETVIKIEESINNSGNRVKKTAPTQQFKQFQYVAFPLQPNDDEKQQKDWKAEVRVGVKLKIALSYPKEFKIYKKDKDGKTLVEKTFDSSIEVHSAFWAWGIFGGIGARTRRGFGALKLSKHKIDGNQKDLQLFETKEILESQAKAFVYGGKPPKGVPYLDKILRVVVTDENQNKTEVWKTIVEKYKSFRQQRNGTGRSKWNEPEVIRNLIGQRLETGDPKDSHRTIKPDFEKFPRAEFGLPIVFQFHYEDTWKTRRTKSDDKNVDPRKTILKVSDLPNQKRERFSSPLILRPIACKNGNFIGIALILENETTLDKLGLTLEAQENPKVIIKTGLKSKLDNVAKEQEQIKTIDGTNLLSTADILQAFLDYLEN
jgi:CRISPR-associated protein Cmr1